MKPTALLITTTHWVPTARLAIALGNAGFRVEALCPPRHPLGKANSAHRMHVYQGLTPLKSLARAIAVAKPDLIVPGDDLATYHLHELYRQRKLYSDENALGSLIQRSLGSPEHFAAMHARAAFIKFAQEQSVRCPKTDVIESGEDLTGWIGRTGLPAVLKADGTSGGAGVRMVRTLEEAHLAFRRLKAPPLLARAFKRALLNRDRTLVWSSILRRRSTVNAQAFVVGHEATSTIACWEGAVLSSLHFEVLRKCTAAGHATVVRRIENVEMSSAIDKLARVMRLSGLFGFDFMLEAGSGKAYLIEVNPRATQVGHITLGPGRDLPSALYGAVSGQSLRPAPPVTANDTIALFPQEWARDPQSEFLRTGYHDVPWNTPELVHLCVRQSRKRSKWYSRGDGNQEIVAQPIGVNIPAKSAPVGVDCSAD